MTKTTLVFEKADAKWHLKIHRDENGLAVIERIRCPKSIKPGTWTSPDCTPEEWVALQRDARKFLPVKAE